MFHGGSVTQLGLTQLKRVLQNTSCECAEIVDRDQSIDGPRMGAAFLLMLGPWSYRQVNGRDVSTRRARA
ncbi:MAG TPA: hypothetical protein VF193_05895 [Steroidobacter sp.]